MTVTYKPQNAYRYDSYSSKSDVVYAVVYEASKTKTVSGTELKATLVGTVALDVSNLGSDFVAFDDITESTLTTWTTDALTSDEETAEESTLDARLSELETQMNRSTGLPY